MYIDPGPERISNRWAALITDFTDPATKSDWSRTVTDCRIVDFDRIRPFVTRGAILTALAVTLLVLPGCSPLTLILLLPGLLQVVLEVVLEPIMRKPVIVAGDMGWFLRPMVRLWVRNYEKTIANATGLIGAVAVLANIIAVEFCSGTAGPGWLRVLALTFAVLYCCSGVLGVLIDTPWYSPLETTPALVGRFVKPAGWAVVVVLLMLSVLVADHYIGPWADGSLPYALGVCALGYYIGLRARDYDRDLGAAAKVMVIASADDQRYMAHEMHDYFQSAKEGLEFLMTTADLTVSQRSSLQIFIYDMNDLYRQAKTGKVTSTSLFRPPIKNRVRAICEAGRMDFRGSEFNLEQHIDPDNYRLARNITTTLALNCKQAYEHAYALDDTLDIDNDIRIVMRQVGPTAVIEVSDLLTLIPDRIWDRADTTLGTLRRELQNRGGGLDQIKTSDGKTIRATWIVYPQPILDNRPLREG